MGKADFFDRAEGPLVLCRPEADLKPPKNVRITDGMLRSDDAAFLKNQHFSQRFYGLGKDCRSGLFKRGTEQKCSDFWGRWTTDSFGPCEVVMLDDEAVQPSKDLLWAQARNAASRFAAHGLPAPRTWIRPGGWKTAIRLRRT